MKNKSLFHLLCCASVALIIIVMGIITFIRPIFLVQKSVDSKLQLIVTGEKTKESSGNEVRISKIIVNQTQTIPLNQYAIDGWSMDGDILALYRVAGPTSLNIPLVDIKKLDVEFITQRGSGIVELNIGHVKEVVDLYSNNDWVKKTWHYEVPKEFKPLSRIDLILQLWVILTLILWGGVYWRENGKK